MKCRETVATVTGDMRQRVWGEEDLISLASRVKGFKKVVVELF